MRKVSIALCTLFAIVAILISCAKDNDNALDNNEPQKGYLTGMVTDYQNFPLGNVKIIMDDAVTTSGAVTGETDEQGKYKIKIPYGAWTANAVVTKQYHNKEYALECKPDETSSFTNDGAVRNFQWKIAGKIPNVAPAKYYGGSIGIYPSESSIIPDNTYIQITLTPTGPMIDGSVGEPIVLRMRQGKWMEDDEIKDIPIGQYKATVIFKAEEDLPLKVRNCFDNGTFQYEVVFDFEPEKIYRSRTWYKAMVLEFHE